MPVFLASCQKVPSTAPAITVAPIAVPTPNSTPRKKVRPGPLDASMVAASRVMPRTTGSSDGVNWECGILIA